VARSASALDVDCSWASPRLRKLGGDWLSKRKAACREYWKCMKKENKKEKKKKKKRVKNCVE